MRSKKWLGLFLTLCMILSGLPVVQAHAVQLQFYDIQGHWAYQSIARAVEQGIFAGTSDSTFSPDDTLTRAMFVTMLAKYHGHDSSAYYTSVFRDVPADSWYAPAVAWAAENGIVSGTSNEMFSPDMPITREQIAVMMVSYANFTGRVLPRVRPPKGFYDISACADYALDAVYTSYRAGLFSGVTNTQFGPKNIATRAQCAVIMCAYMDICEHNYLDTEKIQLVNHRGYNMTAPENTLPAFQMSATVGYSMVEADVRFTQDNIPVLLHDTTIERTSDGYGQVSSMTYAQLQKYDFGGWKSDVYKGTKIPTFEEFIALCKQNALHPFIEIKGEITSGQARSLVDTVSKYGMSDNVTWMSFYYTNNLQNIAAWNSSASFCVLTDSLSSDVIQKAINLQNGKNYVSLNVESANFNAEKRAVCLRYGLDFGVWVLDDRLNVTHTANTSAQFIITDNVLWNTIY